MELAHFYNKTSACFMLYQIKNQLPSFLNNLPCKMFTEGKFEEVKGHINMIWSQSQMSG